jgi:hypothetical protein
MKGPVNGRQHSLLTRTAVTQTHPLGKTSLGFFETRGDCRLEYMASSSEAGGRDAIGGFDTPYGDKF